MNFFLFDMNENSLENFDTDLQVFYHEVVSKELNLSKRNNVFGIKRALKEVVHAYKKPTVVQNASKILFDSSNKRCAYVLKHCPCFSSAVAKHFFQLLRRNPELFDHSFHHQQINLCCLGGGPGTEIVAIAKVFGLLKNFAVLRRKTAIHLKIIEVDLSEEWKSTAQIILQTFQRNPLFYDPETFQISFELIKADLTEPLEENVKKALHEADIITMVYFVSAVNGSKAQSKCVPMLQNIMEQAKPGALLFFLDSAKNLHYNSLMDSLNKFQNFRLIYGPFIQEFHTLSMKSIKKFIELYFNQFNTFLLLTNCFITCVGLLKEVCFNKELQHKDFVKESDSIFRIRENRKWLKMREFNSRRQIKFRQKVEKLILCEIDMNFETDDRDESDYKQEMEFSLPHKNIFYAGKAKRKRIILDLE